MIVEEKGVVQKLQACPEICMSYISLKDQTLYELQIMDVIRTVDLLIPTPYLD